MIVGLFVYVCVSTFPISVIPRPPPSYDCWMLIKHHSHTSIFSGKYDTYLWPVVFVWSLDRLARIVRIARCNIHIRLRRNLISRTRATVSYNKTSDIIRLEITPRSRKIDPKPGQYYYLYQPLRWRGYMRIILLLWGTGLGAMLKCRYLQNPNLFLLLGSG